MNDAISRLTNRGSTRRNLLKLATMAGAGAGLVTLSGPVARDAAALQATPVTGGSLNVDMSTDKPADPTLSAAGSASFGVGGKLTIPSGTADGVYSNTFNVTANYK